MRCKYALLLVLLLLSQAGNRVPRAGGLQILNALDLALINGKIITVDSQFSIHPALGVKSGRIEMVGTNPEVQARIGPQTEKIDLQGKAVIPGLIDSHVHPLEAGLSEFRGSLPRLKSIVDIQNFIREKAKTVPKEEWISVPRTFPTRLKEERMPTKNELDEAAPEHPVLFDASYTLVLNSAALKAAGITRHTPDPKPGEIAKDPKTGEPNGILRGAQSLLSKARKTDSFTQEEKLEALQRIFKRYNEVGITSIGDRSVDPEEIALYDQLKTRRALTVRTALTVYFSWAQPLEKIIQGIEKLPYKTNDGDEWVKFGPLKTNEDGGMLIGTAYMRWPYGPVGMQVYGHASPDYRGLQFLPLDKLTKIVETARRKGWQMTAHAQGGAAADTLLEAYKAVNAKMPIKDLRYTLTHTSFPNEAMFKSCAEMGVTADIQMPWLYRDGDVLLKVLGPEKMKLFIPTKSWMDAGIPVSGGCDHMIGYDSFEAVNPYNPFLGMWIAITRKTDRGTVINPEQAISREQALRFYTINNAWLTFDEKNKGSLEVGKLADITVISDDILTCPEDNIKNIRAEMTLLGGRVIYKRR